MQWKDLDLDKAVVRIERSVEQTKGQLPIRSPKTKHGHPNIAISPWLVAELRESISKNSTSRSAAPRKSSRRRSLGWVRIRIKVRTKSMCSGGNTVAISVPTCKKCP